MQYVLAGVEGRAVGQSSVLPREDLTVPLQFAGVETVAENVRKRRAVESRLALAVGGMEAAFFESRAIEGSLVDETVEAVCRQFGYFRRLRLGLADAKFLANQKARGALSSVYFIPCPQLV